MNLIRIFPSLLLIIFLLTACSWRSKFIIYNNSTIQATIKYQLSTDDNQIFNPPEAGNLNIFNFIRNKDDFKLIESSRKSESYSTDIDSFILVTLKPKEALVLGEVSGGYSIDKSQSLNYVWNLLYLKINLGSDSITATQNLTKSLFNEVSVTEYNIIIR